MPTIQVSLLPDVEILKWTNEQRRIPVHTRVQFYERMLLRDGCVLSDGFFRQLVRFCFCFQAAHVALSFRLCQKYTTFSIETHVVVNTHVKRALIPPGLFLVRTLPFLSLLIIGNMKHV